MKKKTNFKRKAKKAILTATAATSLLVNNAYDNPLDMIDDVNMSDSLEDMDEDRKKNDLRSSTRRLLGKIPMPARGAILIPLWLIGWVLMQIVEPLIEYLIIPFIKWLASWSIVFALVLAVVAIAAMILFPGLPLSKILNKKTIKLALIIIAIFAIGDKIADLTIEDYHRFKQYVKLAAIMSATGVVLWKIYRINRKLKIKIFTEKYQFAQEF